MNVLDLASDVQNTYYLIWARQYHCAKSLGYHITNFTFTVMNRTSYDVVD